MSSRVPDQQKKPVFESDIGLDGLIVSAINALEFTDFSRHTLLTLATLRHHI
jgi:hypothetical protein